MVRHGFWRRWGWLPALLVFDIILVIWWRGRAPQCAPVSGVDEAVVPIASPSVPVLPVNPVVPPLRLGFPTGQTNLMHGGDENAFMPTAPGRVESAHYGSVRTQNSGFSSFHEGIDIAPLQRDRRQRAMDTVKAVADGTVAYANRSSGNSNYGMYVVLEHADPVGPIYTLYAHLSVVDKHLREGAHITRGETIGVMGNTPSSIIPVVRSHLHFEAGMIRNRRFEAWAKAQKIDNRHGNYNGWNLSGIDPRDLYSSTAPEQSFSMLDYLRSQPAGFELLITISRPLDYFKRFPALWQAEQPPPMQGLIVLAVSEGGVILRGRLPTASELAQHSASRTPVVLSANPEVLGRNGLRLAAERNGRWEPGASLSKWLDILTY